MSVSTIRQPLLKFPRLRGQKTLLENNCTEKSTFRHLYPLLKAGISLLIILVLFAVVWVMPVT
jgi:hypothetical protein